MESLNTPPGAPNSFYTPLLISAIGVFFTCTAIAVYHFILIKYCKRRTEAAANDAQPSVPQASLLPTGVDEKLLQTIPIIAYSSAIEEEGRDHLFRVDQSECVVCLGELEHEEMVRLLPNCKHAFHVPCIDEWFVAHTSCPICRSPIVASPPLVNNDDPLPPQPQLVTPSCGGDGSNRPVELPGQDLEHGSIDIIGSSSSSGVKGQSSFGLLRHCGSLVLPTERPSSSARLLTGLKRSLSMDQFSVIIDIQRERGKNGSSSSSKDDDLATSGSTVGARSMRNLDRVSTKLLSSFSLLRLGKNTTDILPY